MMRWLPGRLRLAAIRAYGPGVLLAAMALAHPWLEQTMARHMGLELPALFMVGWLASAQIFDPQHRLSAWNDHGLPGLLLALCVTAFWMVPAALDMAVLHNGMAWAKVSSMVLAGWLVGVSWARAGWVIQAFFVLNWFWMALAVGLMYQDAPQQLCAVYLVDQQAAAGQALVAWAVVGLGVWMLHMGRALHRLDQADTPADGGRLLAGAKRPGWHPPQRRSSVTKL